MNAIPIPAFSDNYIWVIVDDCDIETEIDSDDVFDCVDPGDAKPILQFAASSHRHLRHVLLTHHHDDHIGGVRELLAHFPKLKVFGPADDRMAQVNHLVFPSEDLAIGKNTYQILSNPGHTSTHISYYEVNKGWLFCGDTLFSAGCGRVFDGTIAELHQSLLMFKQLPGQTKVFCAHEYTVQNLLFAQTVEPQNNSIKTHLENLKNQTNPCSLPSTISLERDINPFFRTHIPEVIDYAINHGAASKDSLDVFKILRQEKNNFK